ncbi:MAG TPA: YcfL family protein [Pseudomonadales bacterium]|nr:YcfL family protein [Pseudomonadales bacterium]
MKKIIALFLLSAVFILAGCATTADRRIMTDEDFSKNIDVISVNTTTVGGDMLKAQVELLNKTKDIQRFNYRFEWFDAHGMQINNAMSALIPDQIDGSQSKFVSGVAPTPSCTDFRVRFIKAKPVTTDE